jgi:thiol-disulfide isomerase/thioredoxin
MKMVIILFLTLFLSTDVWGQRLSNSDIGHTAQSAILYDTSGKKINLSDFKGNVLYVDFWIPSCTPCIRMLPYEDTLTKKLESLSLDSNILIIKICDACDFNEWKNLVKANKSKAINLIYQGGKYTLGRRFSASPYPTYHVIGKDYKYLGIKVILPDKKNIDYCLFRATQNIPVTKALNEAKEFGDKFDKGDTDLPKWYLDWRQKLEQLTYR